MRTNFWLAVIPAGLLLAGCPSTPPVEPVDSEAAVDDAGATTMPVDDDAAGRGSEFGDDAQSQDAIRRNQRIIYFDFDLSNIRPEFNEVLAAHARYLADNPGGRVRLEGHADERGSREYNIGLGERRAQSVRRVFLIHGVGANQMITVSFGEERPAALGSDEESWASNRRVEIVY